MKRLSLIIVTLLTLCNVSAQQKTIKYWYIGDTISFKSVEVGDTVKYYRGDSMLTHIAIENDSIKEVYSVDNDSLKLFYKCITKVELALVKDNQCNSITLKGIRCARKVDNLKGNFNCWQHD